MSKNVVEHSAKMRLNIFDVDGGSGDSCKNVRAVLELECKFGPNVSEDEMDRIVKDISARIKNHSSLISVCIDPEIFTKGVINNKT